jgi:hypothetical protein
MNIDSKEFSYILGFLWADGWIRNEKYHKEVRLECLREDIEEIYPHFAKIFDWRMYYRNRPGKRPQARLNLANKELVHFLSERNYTSHNFRSANILAEISEQLQPFWFRGLIDGDGHWGYRPKNRSRVFQLSGAYLQDWSFFATMCNKLQCNFNIYHHISKKGHKSSSVELRKQNSLKKLGEYVYNTYPQDKIGLHRKYDKWIEIINSYKEL